ncbi:specific RNA polymerase II transcription factor [Kwoniella heveanensis CBS 569]|nr:specific RNA polymerase II transcription factor [Kwoniella heveanensis CBS 569]
MSSQNPSPNTYHPAFPSVHGSSRQHYNNNNIGNGSSSGDSNKVHTHPPSKLSPPASAPVAPHKSQSTAQPGAGARASTQSSPVQAGPSKKKDERENNVPKRGYRACVHCRMRKARCDLGDVNAPSEPPCSRCRREQRECVFLPSKRRRRTSGSNAASVDGVSNSAQAVIYPPHPAPSASAEPSKSSFTSGPSQQQQQQTQPHVPSAPILHDSMPTDWHLPSLSPVNQMPMKEESPVNPMQQPPHWPQDILSHPDTTTPGSLGESSVTSASGQSPGHRAKRRRSDREPEGTRKIVNASLSNEMDALEILANAATDGNSEGDSDGHEPSNKGKGVANGEAKRVSWELEEETVPPRELRDFHLIKAGILDELGLQDLVSTFFRDHHPSLPVFQTARIPRTREQLIDLAYDDPFLLTCIITVASRHPLEARYRDVHEKTWAILRQTMADYSFHGLPSSIGFVEGVLLLAEHLPREKRSMTKETSFSLLVAPGGEATGEHGTENRRSWSLIGLAIRAAYLIGLDQIALEINEGQRDPEVERARSAWTWCYLYDRTIDKTGLAFWSRGPSLCFVGYSHISQTGSAAARENFPLQLSPGEVNDENTHDDSASLMQALVELTQIMTNAHDILYPSKSRTAILVRQGEYFLFLDHFRRALDSYRSIWKPKKWSNATLHELSWMTFHFVRLYISSFGYSAHVKRAQWRAEEEAQAGREAARHPVQIFPRGSATSPDAIYIYESIGSANEILHISLRLAQMGSFRYLPLRYLINISYAAVFALKSSYSGAVTGKDMLRIRELVDHVCAALVLACPDKDHPAVRYGQMLRMLSKKLEQLSDASAVPSRFPSPEPSSDPSSSSHPFGHSHSASHSHSHAHGQSTPIPWTLPTETVDPPSFHMSSFPDISPLPSMFTNQGISDLGLNLGLGPSDLSTSASGAASGLPAAGTGGGQGSTGASGEMAGGATMGIGGATEGLFDFEGNLDFDLKGFWDDFTLGTGSYLPFR